MRTEIPLVLDAMAIAKKKYYIWFVLIFLAAWNAVLRPTPTIPVTPYYLLMPLVFIILFSRARYARSWAIWFAGFAIYGVAIGFAFGVPFSMQIAQLLKYAQLITFLLMLTWLYRTSSTTVAGLHGLVAFLTILAFAIAGLQLVTGFEFPTVINEESGLWLNTYFYTPNDLALFLCGVFCLVLCGNYSLLIKWAFFLAFFALNIRNDAKAAALASVLMAVTYALLMVCRRFRIKPFFVLLILILLIFFFMFTVGDEYIEIGNSEFNFFQLFLDPFERIYYLDPYNLGGSIFDRTDALIHSIEAMKSMSWLGLGPAGSVYNLSLPNNELLTAKSLHNAIAEIFFEFGLFALVLFLMLLRPLKKAIFSHRLSSQQICLVCFFAASPLLSVSQSSGFISNYAFWLTAFLIWYPAAVGEPPIYQSTQSGIGSSLPSLNSSISP